MQTPCPLLRRRPLRPVPPLKRGRPLASVIPTALVRLLKLRLRVRAASLPRHLTLALPAWRSSSSMAMSASPTLRDLANPTAWMLPRATMSVKKVPKDADVVSGGRCGESKPTFLPRSPLPRLRSLYSCAPFFFWALLSSPLYFYSLSLLLHLYRCLYHSSPLGPRLA